MLQYVYDAFAQAYMAAVITSDSVLLDYNLLQWEVKRGLRVSLAAPGSYGAVYKAMYNGRPVAVKQIDISLWEVSGAQQEERLLREFDVHRKIVHEVLGALHLAKCNNGGDEYYIVVERLRGSLDHLVLKEDGFLHSARRLYECAQALRFMHDRDIIHANLKPKNILLDFEGSDVSTVNRAKAKITGLGLSRVQIGTILARSTSKGKQGPPLYMDPALYDGMTAISRSSDAYSFGILAWQLITGDPPFQHLCTRDVTIKEFESAVRHGARPALTAVCPLLPDGMAGAVTTLLEACWDGDAAMRTSMASAEERLRCVLECWDAAVGVPAMSAGGAGAVPGVPTPA